MRILGITQEAPPVSSGLSEVGVHSRPCSWEGGGPHGFSLECWFSLVSRWWPRAMGTVCVHVWVSAWATAACSALWTTLPSLPFLLPGPLTPLSPKTCST